MNRYGGMKRPLILVRQVITVVSNAWTRKIIIIIAAQ